MSKTPLKKLNGQTLGYIESEKDGKQKATLVDGNTIGYYDPQSNTTKSPTGEIIGKGNLLANLLMDRKAA